MKNCLARSLRSLGGAGLAGRPLWRGADLSRKPSDHTMSATGSSKKTGGIAIAGMARSYAWNFRDILVNLMILSLAMKADIITTKQQPRSRNVLFISLSQFGIVFSFNFVMVFLPFYIHTISPYKQDQTLIWVGLIMGASSFMAAVASTFWGGLAARYNPKTLFMRRLLSHAVLICLMGFVTHLPLLFALRIAQGILGEISTVGFIVVSASSTPEAIAKSIGFYQNALTLGQLMGPPLGAFAASVLGYRGAFLGAAGLVFITLVFCFIYVEDVPPKPKTETVSGKGSVSGRIFFAWILCFAVTVQLMFLPGILPNVFESMGIGHAVALKWSGVFVMAYTATAIIGTFVFCRLASRVGSVRLIIWIVGLSILLQALLAVCPGIRSFVAVRMMQAALIAAILPLIISLFTSGLSGKVIGPPGCYLCAGCVQPELGISVHKRLGHCCACRVLVVFQRVWALTLPLLVAGHASRAF